MKDIVVKIDKATLLFRNNITTYFGKEALHLLDLFQQNNITSNDDRLKFLKKNFKDTIIIIES